MKQRKITGILVCWGLLAGWLGSMALQVDAQEKASAVSNGAEVSIEYTLKLDDKSVFDTNVGAEPLTYVQGSRQIVPGLEKALEGMKAGESKQVTVQPEEGYGPVQKEAVMEIGKDKIPGEAQQVGAQVQGQTGDGRVVRARVAEVKDSTVVLDFNHPLAGKTLHFDVKVVNIQQKTAN